MMDYDSTIKQDASSASSSCSEVMKQSQQQPLHHRQGLHQALASSSLIPAFHDLILDSLHKQFVDNDDDVYEHHVHGLSSISYEEGEKDQDDDEEEASDIGFIKYCALLSFGSFLCYGIELFKRSSSVGRTFKKAVSSVSDTSNTPVLQQPASNTTTEVLKKSNSQVSIQDFVQSALEANNRTQKQQEKQPWWITMNIGLLVIWIAATAVARVR